MKKESIAAISVIAGAAAGAEIAKRMGAEAVQKQRGYAKKHLALYIMMNQWVRVKQEGKNLSEYFSRNGYRKIAIYGMSYAGETLLEELKGTDITVAYGIDKNADSIYADVDIVTAEDALAEVDAIVVTSITFFDEIKEVLNGRVNCPVISLEDVLYEA